ncbi:MAG: alpha/beta fold hydrolase [Campylobacterota bacterium]
MQKTIDGLEVYTAGNTNSRPIIFIHGFPFDHSIWNEAVAQLQNDYYCISYDIRGFGRSKTAHGQYTMESYVDDLETIITQLQLQQVILCGFSMGGYIALRASERLQTCKAFILANTTTSADDNTAKLKRAKAIKSIEKEGVAPFLDTFFSAAFTKHYLQEDEQTVAKLKTKILSFDRVGIKGGLLAMISRTDTAQSLQALPQSLLISAGEDKIIPPQEMKDMAAKIPNSQYVVIPNSGHVSMLEKPQEFIEAIQSFLHKL